MNMSKDMIARFYIFNNLSQLFATNCYIINGLISNIKWWGMCNQDIQILRQSVPNFFCFQRSICKAHIIIIWAKWRSKNFQTFYLYKFMIKISTYRFKFKNLLFRIYYVFLIFMIYIFMLQMIIADFETKIMVTSNNNFMLTWYFLQELSKFFKLFWTGQPCKVPSMYKYICLWKLLYINFLMQIMSIRSCQNFDYFKFLLHMSSQINFFYKMKNLNLGIIFIIASLHFIIKILLMESERQNINQNGINSQNCQGQYNLAQAQYNQSAQPQAIQQYAIQQKLSENNQKKQNQKCEMGQKETKNANNLSNQQVQKKIKAYIKYVLISLISLVGIFLLIIGMVTFFTQQLSTFFSVLGFINYQKCFLIIGIFLFLFSIACIIAIKRNFVIGLHIYWITCIIFLFIYIVVVYSFIGNPALSTTCGSGSYFLEQVNTIDQTADNMFCTQQCPCKYTNTTKISTRYYQKVQDCPNWQSNYISDFLSSIQFSFQCTGWCNPSKNNLTLFVSSQFLTYNDEIPCFQAFSEYLKTKNNYLLGIGITIFILMLGIIILINFYIFLIGEQSNQLERSQDAKPF